MNEEEKMLLLKDLCARLPYETICQVEDKLIISHSPFYDCILSEGYIALFRNHKDFHIKPYLRPMSSMTEEEEEQFQDVNMYELPYRVEGLDWLNAHHFDYRGLIEKGLALSTEEFNPYKD